MDRDKEQEQRNAQLATEEKAKLFEEVRNLSDGELNDFQRFWNYVDYPVGPDAHECC